MSGFTKLTEAAPSPSIRRGAAGREIRVSQRARAERDLKLRAREAVRVIPITTPSMERVLSSNLLPVE